MSDQVSCLPIWSEEDLCIKPALRNNVHDKTWIKLMNNIYVFNNRAKPQKFSCFLKKGKMDS